MSKESIFKHLLYSDTDNYNEFQSCLESGTRLNFKEQNRAIDTALHPKIKNLLRTDKSEYLLINENSDHSARLSSSSYLSGVLTQFVEKKPTRIPVAFFYCGLHDDDTGTKPLARPLGMLMRLVSQIVSCFEEKWIDDIEVGIWEALMGCWSCWPRRWMNSQLDRLFPLLLTQFRSTTLRSLRMI